VGMMATGARSQRKRLPMQRKATDQQLLACCRAGLTLTETANRFGLSSPTVHERARKLGLVFVKRPGIHSEPQEDTCAACSEQKLCLMCHKLRVAALPCESDLLVNGHSEAQLESVHEWQYWFARLSTS